jgi:ParB family transcriptional regulator, chromosome partitioning protein
VQGQPKLPPKADRVYGKPGKSEHTAMYLDREGKVQSVCYRMPATAKKKAGNDESASEDGPIEAPKARPKVTRKGHRNDR